MLIESSSKGLVLEFDRSLDNRARIDNPLDVVFPPNKDLGKGANMSSYQIKNGLKVDMHDLRKVHSLGRYGTRYEIYLNLSKVGPKKFRQPFAPEGTLKGYFNYGLPPFF